MTAVILAVAGGGLFLIRRLDQDIRLSGRGRLTLAAAAWLGDLVIGRSAAWQERPVRICMAVVVGCLLLACVTDLRICQVYNFVWWVSAAAGMGMLAGTAGRGSAAARGAIPAFLLFCAVQGAVFSRLYGRADCYAYCVCALTLTALGRGMTAFLLHMLSSFLLLCVVQIGRNNVGRDGNLKQPVPFLPYITAGFYLALLQAAGGI